MPVNKQIDLLAQNIVKMEYSYDLCFSIVCIFYTWFSKSCVLPFIITKNCTREDFVTLFRVVFVIVGLIVVLMKYIVGFSDYFKCPD